MQPDKIAATGAEMPFQPPSRRGQAAPKLTRTRRRYAAPTRAGEALTAEAAPIGGRSSEYDHAHPKLDHIAQTLHHDAARSRNSKFPDRSSGEAGARPAPDPSSADPEGGGRAPISQRAASLKPLKILGEGSFACGDQ